VRGRALVRQGRAQGWNPLPQALPAIDGSAAVQAAFPGLAEPDLVFDELRVTFIKAVLGAWAMPRLYATGAGFTVDGSVQINRDQNVSGTGTVQLAAALPA